MATKRALWWVAFWITLAAVFDAGVYYFLGKQKALEFFGGYIIEQSLSMDNLFVFLVIFNCYGIQPLYQRRVLNYGIFGAVVLRLIFIVLGIAVVNKFHWVLYIFGLILIASGVKLFFNHDSCEDYRQSRILKWLGWFIPLSGQLQGEKFFVRINKVLYATPLLAILVLIEGSDLLFAIDSIPAVFSISTDPFIVYSSNIFAILGLRNMYFLLEKMHEVFRFVKYGVAFILCFTGIKLTVLFFSVEIPLLTSLATIFTILAISIILSVLIPVRAGIRCKNGR